jgi:hypothetical protein
VHSEQVLELRLHVEVSEPNMHAGFQNSQRSHVDLQKRKSLKAQRAAKKAARQGERPFQVDSSVREALEGANLTENQVFEGRAILILGLIFSVCVLEGIIVAASVCFICVPANGTSLCFAQMH